MPTINFPSSPTNGQEYSYLGKSWRFNGVGWALTNSKPYGREVLTAARTYYVATTGSDSNDGLTAGTPFLTIQKAIDTFALLDTAIYSVTVQIADGTYTAPNSHKAAVGSGSLTIQGNATTPSNVFINSVGNCFYNSVAGAVLSIKNLKVASTGIGIFGANSSITSYNNIVFGACSAAQVTALNGAFITGSGANFILGDSPAHIMALFGGGVTINSSSVTFLANVALANFAYIERGGMLRAEAFTYNMNGFTMTGTKMWCKILSFVFTGNPTAGYFPGSYAYITDASSVYA